MNDFLHSYSTKGASIKKSGYETSVHALPDYVKQKLDLMLKCKYSPKRILAELSRRFPHIQLPSKTAIYNYRSKYFEKSTVSVSPVTTLENELRIR